LVKRFNVSRTKISELIVVERVPRLDPRGFLERFFCTDEMREVLQERTLQQINHTLTRSKGTVRGMHMQKAPHAEMKFISCIKGEVFDVAVDLRPSSPTFGHWHGEILSQNNFKTLVIPEGFAHGFQTLADDCELIYLHTASFAPQAEAGISAVDKMLNISWPLPVDGLSERDIKLPMLRDFKQ
jgi:dTDP-4-dehydrorhamnose 3,5-epimerase